MKEVGDVTWARARNPVETKITVPAGVYKCLLPFICFSYGVYVSVLVTCYAYSTLFWAFSLSHAVLGLGTDNLVLLMHALKRKGRVWVGKKYIQDETWWLAKERTPEEGISGAVFILQHFARSIEWHYLFRLISFYKWEVRPLRIEFQSPQRPVSLNNYNS